MTTTYEFTTEGGAKWIRFVAPPAGEFEAALAKLSLPPAASKIFQEGDVRSVVDVHEQSVLIKMPSLTAQEGRAGGSSRPADNGCGADTNCPRRRRVVLGEPRLPAWLDAGPFCNLSVIPRGR